MVEAQYRIVDRAVFDEGPYSLNKEMAGLGVSNEEFSNLSQQERSAILRRFHQFEPICNLEENIEFSLEESESESDTATTSSPTLPCLYVSYQECNLSPLLFHDIWAKASRLLAEDAIVAAPLSTDSWLVASESQSRPNFVTNQKGNTFTCDCTGFREKALCSHSLAVGESIGRLPQMLKSF